MPLLPARLLRRLRGAVAHDVAARHGLGLSTEARSTISEPSRSTHLGALLAMAAFVAKRAFRRAAALGVLPSAIAWLDVYALGLLFDRYLARARASRTARIGRDEARDVRKAIDRAIRRALSLRLRLEPGDVQVTAEDLRDLSTRLSDGILLALASVPGHLRRRLETAFDEVLAEASVAHGGSTGAAHV